MLNYNPFGGTGSGDVGFLLGSNDQFTGASYMPELAPSGQYYVYPDGNMSNLKGPGAQGPYSQSEAQQKAFSIKGGTIGSSTGTSGTSTTGLESILGTFQSQKGQSAIAGEDTQAGYPSWMTSYPNVTQNWQDLFG
jgi:hypothetical protein